MMGLASGSHGQPVKLYQLSSNPCRSLLSFSFISSHTETLSILILPKRGGGGGSGKSHCDVDLLPWWQDKILGVYYLVNNLSKDIPSL